MHSPLTVYILLILLIALTGTFITIILKLKRADREKNKAIEKFRELEHKVNTLELETIKYKLNPHLFKNTLNSIQSHAYQTYYALDKLSNVLDFILYESERQYVTLKNEIEFSLSLIEINRLKVSPLFDLRIKNKIDLNNPEVTELMIAPLITIDLIENAFKHADIQNPDAFISITFELNNDEFTLIVSNKISSKPIIKKERSGFGKENLRKRLSIIYPGRFTLEQFEKDEVYISQLKINLRESKNQMYSSGR